MTEEELRAEVAKFMRDHAWGVFDGMNDGERPPGETWPQHMLDAFPDGWAKLDGRWVQLSDVDRRALGEDV